MTFSPGAASIWLDHFNLIEAQMGPMGCWYLIKDFAAKAAENSARIAALFELIQTGGLVISEESIRSAIDVVTFYLEQFDSIFGAGRQAQRDQEMAEVLKDWILDWAVEHPTERAIPIRHVYRFGPKCTRASKTLRRVIAHLRGFAWIETCPPRRPGNPVVVLRYHFPSPAVRYHYQHQQPPLFGL